MQDGASAVGKPGYKNLEVFWLYSIDNTKPWEDLKHWRSLGLYTFVQFHPFPDSMILRNNGLLFPAVFHSTHCICLNSIYLFPARIASIFILENISFCSIVSIPITHKCL